MASAVLLQFWVVSLLFIATPGLDWAYVLSAGLRGAVVPAVAGLVLGHLTATVVVATGVGALISSASLVHTALTVTGAAYLLSLGLSMIVRPTPLASTASAGDSWRRWLVKGFAVSGLNPKVMVFLIALLPQFTDRTAPLSVPLQMIMLGVVQATNCVVVYLIAGFTAGALLRSRPHAAEKLTRVSGVAIVALAVVLLCSPAR